MSPAFIFTTNGEIMALKGKDTQEETQTVKQVNFDDLVQSTEAS